MGRGLSSYSGTPDEHYRWGLQLLDRDQPTEAFEHLSIAFVDDPQTARFRSGYGVALAVVRGQYLPAVLLAREALREEFYNPELYLLLARIYVACEERGDAVRCLRQGIRVDRRNRALLHAYRELGIRRAPVLPFLARGNPANRLLGRLDSHLPGSKRLRAVPSPRRSRPGRWTGPPVAAR